MKLIALVNDYEDNAKRFAGSESKAVFPLLVKQADFAMRAGVALTLSDYVGMSLLERLAFTQAGDALRAKDAQRIGVASSSLMGAALATVEYDDGAAAELLALEAEHAAAVEEASG